MASGDTKTEALLNILGNGGTGDEYRGCGNTKTQNYILDAIDRINALDPSGGGSAIKTLSSSDVTGKDEEDVDIIELWKLPTGVYAYKANEDYYTVANKGYDPDTSEYYINYTFDKDCLIVVSATPGDVVYCTVVCDNGVYSFIAIDEYGYTNQIFTNNTFDNELSGTVPAPTESDANKFLRGDGSWAEAGGNMVYNVGEPFLYALNNKEEWVQIDPEVYAGIEQAVREGKLLVGYRDDQESCNFDFIVVGYSRTAPASDPNPAGMEFNLYGNQSGYIHAGWGEDGPELFAEG